MKTDDTESRPPLPPFTLETAIQKVRAAEDGTRATRNGFRSPTALIADGAIAQSF
jgi:nuclear transport factor 2 (NTF2) superfamily protein